MGQEIDFNPDEWDFQEDFELEVMQSEITLPNDFYKGNSISRSESSGFEKTSLEKSDRFSQSDKATITAYIDGEKIQLDHNLDHNFDDNGSERLFGSQEEEAFRRQIEDLFELLELEKESDKENGVRVYQTDSSPSRPWRFH